MPQPTNVATVAIQKGSVYGLAYGAQWNPWKTSPRRVAYARWYGRRTWAGTALPFTNHLLILMKISTEIYVEFPISRSASFSCPACQHGHEGTPGGFFVNLSEAEDHVRKNHGVSEDVYGSINLPEQRQSLTPFKCSLCKSPFVLSPSEQQLKKHMKSAHSDWHASTARQHSKRVCRFCLKLVEQEKACSLSECKWLVKRFANAQEQSNALSYALSLIGALFVAAVIHFLFSN